MRNRRAWGYIAEISTGASANIHTTYLPAAFVRLVYLRFGETEFSCDCAMANTYTPKCLTSVDVPIHEGSPIFGFSSPTSGNYTDANFATRKVAGHAAWMSGGLGPAVCTSDVDIDSWSWAPFPTLGASGFLTKKTIDPPARITGLRIGHPLLDVREYNGRTSGNFRESNLLPLSLYLSY